MFQLWVRQFKNHHALQEIVISDDSSRTRTQKIFHALEEACVAFDLGKPIWLDATVSDFKKYRKARFSQDCFIENIDFDYLEIQILEED